MYLTIKQHDMFRTLLMGFEIPYRLYIAEIIIELKATFLKSSGFFNKGIKKYR